MKIGKLERREGPATDDHFFFFFFSLALPHYLVISGSKPNTGNVQRMILNDNMLSSSITDSIYTVAWQVRTIIIMSRNDLDEALA